LFAFALCLIAAMANGDQLFSNREDADVLVDTVDNVRTMSQRKLLSTNVLSEEQHYTKEDAIVEKIKALKDDLKTTAKKCSVPKPVKVHTKRATKKVKKCKNVTEIKKLMKRNDSILKNIKRQIVIAKKPKKPVVSTALDKLKSALKVRRTKFLKKRASHDPLELIVSKLRKSEKSHTKKVKRDALSKLQRLLKQKVSPSKHDKVYKKHENALKRLLKDKPKRRVFRSIRVRSKPRKFRRVHRRPVKHHRRHKPRHVRRHKKHARKPRHVRRQKKHRRQPKRHYRIHTAAPVVDVPRVSENLLVKLRKVQEGKPICIE